MTVNTRTERCRSLPVLAAVAMVAALISPLLSASAVSAAPGDITTFAGGGVGDGGPATNASLFSPNGLTVGPGGDVFIADTFNNRVRRVSPSGIITTVAGNGTPGFSGDGGPATSAQLRLPSDVILDAAGNLFIADSINGRIRRVDHLTGIITTVAGGAPFVDNVIAGDGGPATAALLGDPTDVLFDAAGNLYIAQTFAVRKISAGADGKITGAADEIITTVAGNGTQGSSGDGGLATNAQLNRPEGLAFDPAGNLYIADEQAWVIRKVDHSTGIISTYAGTGVHGYTGDGGPATAAQLGEITDLAADSAGNLYVADPGNTVVRRIDYATGIITTVAGPNYGFGGDGGPATAAKFGGPSALAVDGAGNLFISDADLNGNLNGSNNRIRKVDASGIVTTFAGGGIGDGLPGPAAVLQSPQGVHADAAGNVFITERGIVNGPGQGDRVRKVDSAGIITTIAGGGAPADDLGDNGPATAASLRAPVAVTEDAAGNVYILDCGHDRVRKVDTSGLITTVVGNGSPGFMGDGGLATLASINCSSFPPYGSPPRIIAGGLFVVTAGTDPPPGTLFLADAGNNRIRRIDTSGVISTVAGDGSRAFGGDGGSATSAQLDSPSDVVLDATNNMFIADTGNNRIRKVDAGGRITTVAGNGTTGPRGDDGPATDASLTSPTGVALDAAGALYVAEYGFHRVRKIDTSGFITTVAGYGNNIFAGDGGPATSAGLNHPTQVSLDPAGDLFIADQDNNRVREVQAGAPVPPAAGCGRVITRTTKLTRDIGPCAGDGVIVGADNVTLDLNGHHVVGRPGSGDSVGIRLTSRSGVTVKGGSTPILQHKSLVTGFGAGVAIIGGSNNTVADLVVRGNVGQNNPNSQFGDGIAAFFSSNNRILRNTVIHNGIYENIGILGSGSDNNLVQGNVVRDAYRGDIVEGGAGILVNSFLSEELPRQVSIRGNRIIGNKVSHNDAAGISDISNIGGEISKNVVLNNGVLHDSFTVDGIGVRSLPFAEAATRTLVQHNTVHGNYGDGILVTSQQNRILDNNAANNTPGPNSGYFDLHDENSDPSTGDPSCDANVWSGNVWGLGGFFPDCASAAGSSASAPAVSRSATAAAGPQMVPARSSSQLYPSRAHPPIPSI